MTVLLITRPVPGACPLGEAGGIDVTPWWPEALAWCGCGWNRSRVTRRRARRALLAHYAGKVVR